MSERADQYAEEAIARLRLQRRNDDRMTRENTGTKRKPVWRISCSACATVLGVGEDVDVSLALARRNAKARPCCDLWRAT